MAVVRLSHDALRENGDPFGKFLAKLVQLTEVLQIGCATFVRQWRETG